MPMQKKYATYFRKQNDKYAQQGREDALFLPALLFISSNKRLIFQPLQRLVELMARQRQIQPD